MQFCLKYMRIVCNGWRNEQRMLPFLRVGICQRARHPPRVPGAPWIRRPRLPRLPTAINRLRVPAPAMVARMATDGGAENPARDPASNPKVVMIRGLVNDDATGWSSLFFHIWISFFKIALSISISAVGDSRLFVTRLKKTPFVGVFSPRNYFSLTRRPYFGGFNYDLCVRFSMDTADSFGPLLLCRNIDTYNLSHRGCGVSAQTWLDGITCSLSTWP